ncbi:50S ribosomal protein L18 domain protein [Corynebacterium sp. DNF00584]|nr:50S ribosomal protein L18 domain protein [Corynebacterium sp. DNF00584]
MSGTKAHVSNPKVEVEGTDTRRNQHAITSVVTEDGKRLAAHARFTRRHLVRHDPGGHARVAALLIR